jgi:L-threonylcarbamoyladenylate synthase
MSAVLRLDATDDPAAVVDEVVELLLEGGVVVLPTDTVYGLAALPGDAAAMARVFDLKGRDARAPIAVLCADLRQVGTVVHPGCVAVLRPVAERWWPGPLTLVLPRRPGVALHLGEPEATVGVRVPDHDLLRALTERVGPIAATSANRHRQPTAATVEEAVLALGADGLAAVVDAGALEGRASTVLDTTTSPWRVLREGPLPADEICLAHQPRLL